MEGPFHVSERAALLVDSSSSHQQSPPTHTHTHVLPGRSSSATRGGPLNAWRTANPLSSITSPAVRKLFVQLYPVAIFCVTSALLFADQNLMAPNLTDIAKSFGFDDSERDKYLGGYIGAAFYMFGAPAALVFGYLSNYVSRRLLFVIAVLLGEGPCILTIFVTRYWQLFVLRLLTGISIGGCLPLIFSLLSDMYEHEQRSLVSAVVQVAVGMGIAAGQGVAGYIGPWLGWRWPFVIVAIPAVLCAGLMYATTEEPEKGSTERAVFQAAKVRRCLVWGDERGGGVTSGERSDPLVTPPMVTPPINIRGGVFLRGGRGAGQRPGGGEHRGVGMDTSGWVFLWGQRVAALPVHPTTHAPYTHLPHNINTQQEQHNNTEFSSSYHADLNWDKMMGLASIKTNVYAIGQGLPGCLPWGMLLTFLNDYLAQEKGLAISSATSLVLGIGVGGAFGVIGGGVIGQYLYNRSPRSMPVFIGSCTVLGTLPMWYLIKGAVRAHYPVAFVCSMFAGMLSSTVGPNVRAMIMNVNEPETRGIALALQTTLDDLGKGLGPAIVAVMISGLGRESAFFWATAGWIPCGT